CQNYDTSPLTF
nr:immunoglobulin light chain junction region [Macaca mulatta]